MKCNLIKVNSDKTISHIEWDKPEHTEDQIVVKSIYTGICSSDVAMFNGDMNMLPDNMHGHEGLGEVMSVGKNVSTAKVGDIVATRGEPAFADYYNVRDGEFVVVPAAMPKYILEPVACAVNIADIIGKLGNRSLLMIGTGFLARVIYEVLEYNNKSRLRNVTVTGKAYSDWWDDKGARREHNLSDQYDVVVDLSSHIKYFTADILNNNGHYLMCAEKHGDVDFAPFLWKSIRTDFPSPRTKTFYNSMVKANLLVQKNIINVDDMWGAEYPTTEAGTAFNNRTTSIDKNRTYLTWQQ